MAVLTDKEVDAALPDLNGWERSEGALRRSIKFPAFLDGIERTVTFALVTHSAGGITENDLAMAREINQIVDR